MMTSAYMFCKLFEQDITMYITSPYTTAIFFHCTIHIFFRSKNDNMYIKHIPFLIDFYFNLEKDLKTKCVVEMEGNQTVLHPAITNMNKGDPR